MPTTVDLSALMAKAKSRAQQEPARPVSDLTSIMARAKARASAAAQPVPQDPAQAPADMSGADMAFQAARTAGVEPLPGYALPGAAFASGIAGAAGGASRLAQSAVQFAQDLPTLGRILVTAPVAKAMDVAQDPASLVRPGPQPASSMSRQMMESAIVGTPSEQISRQVVGAVADPIKESLGGFATQARQVERGIDAAANPGAPFDSVKGTVYAAFKSAPIMGTSMGLSLAGAPWAGAALMFATEGGDAAEQAYQYRIEQGDSPEAALQTAFMSGVGTGAINAALEQGGVQRTMSFLRLGEISRRLMGKADQNTVVRVLSRYLADAGVEGGEEIAQGIVSDVAQTVIAGDPSANPLTVDSLERRGVEGGLGFLMGLGGGAASVPSLYQQTQRELPTQTLDRLTKEAQAAAPAGPEAASTQTTAPPPPVPSPVPGETPAQIVTRLEREAQARMQERAGATTLDAGASTPDASSVVQQQAVPEELSRIPDNESLPQQLPPVSTEPVRPLSEGQMPELTLRAPARTSPESSPSQTVQESLTSPNPTTDALPPVGAPPGTDQPTPERAGRIFATLNERIADDEGARTWLVENGRADDDTTTKLAKRMAEAQRKVDSIRAGELGTHNTPDLRHADMRDDADREPMRARAVEELATMVRLPDDNDIRAGEGGALPPGGLRTEKTAVFVLGPPAAGKSTVSSRIADANGAAIIDADYTKRKIPEFFDGPHGAMLVHEESSAMTFGANSLFVRIAEQGGNMVIPAVGSSLPSMQRRLKILKDMGYTVRVVDLRLDPPKATQRAIGRFDSSDRYIPPSYILEVVGQKPTQTYDALKNEGAANEFFALTTDVPYGQDPTILEGDPAALWAPVAGRSRENPPSERDEGGGPDAAGGRPDQGQEGAAAAAAPEVTRNEAGNTSPPVDAGTDGRGGAPGEPAGGRGPGAVGVGGAGQATAVRQPGGRRGRRGGRAQGADGGGGVQAQPVTTATADTGSVEPAELPDGVRAGAERPQAPVAPPRELTPDERNHVIQPGEEVAPPGAVAKFRGNIAAIELLKKLETEDRNATPDEKKVLASYTGWGWAGEYFNESNTRYAKQRAELKKLLTDEEWRAASASTLNAHYTSPAVVRPMWDLAKRLGFAGGRVLEPAAGSGNFLGMMPQDLAESTKFVAVELDSLTGRILTKLYPQADVRVEGFEAARLANNSFDLAISNVPFGGFKIVGKDYDDLLIHDYFFARGLDKVKPGGVVIFVTSDGTLNKIDQRVRKLLADKADLVGAIRLPNNAFAENAGTQVTTDIIVLRKKDGTPFVGQKFLGVEQIGTAPVEEDGVEVQKPILVNEYFAKNPTMALGKHTLEGTMYSAGDYALVARRGVDLGKALAEAVESMPAGVMGAQAAAMDVGTLKAEAGERHGSYVERDGGFFQVVGDEAVPADWLREKLTGDNWSESIDAATRVQRMAVARSWMKLREATRAILTAENDARSTETWLSHLREQLNEQYDTFVNEHGTLNRSQSFREPAGFLASDPDYPLVQALEVEKERVREIKAGKRKGQQEVKTVYEKGPIFSKRVREPKVMPTKAADIQEAVSLSMGWKNTIDPELIGGLLGVSPEQAAEQVIANGRGFRDPATGLLEVRERYLSGNVRKKLKAAIDAATADPQYRPNVEALKAAQPKDVTPGEIRFTLSSRWMPEAVVSAFASDLLQTAVDVKYVREANGYSVDVAEETAKVTSTWAVRYDDRIKQSGQDLLQHALNGTAPLISHTTGRGENAVTIPLPKETAAAKALIERMNREFVSWIRTKDTPVEFRGATMPASQAMATQYNEQMNSVVPVEYDGSYLVLPGASKTVRRVPHRMSVVARILQEGSAVMAHGVGSGKTFSIIVSAMELRRLGLANKPMIVVQKATLGQFARSFKEAYPDSRLLVATEKTFAAKNRKRLMSQVALGDWDAIIVTQPQFERIANNPETVRTYVNQRIMELRAAIEAEQRRNAKKGGRGKGITQKQMEAQIKALQARLDKLAADLAERKDNTVWWEDLGIDALFIDEAHAYKNVPIITRKRNVKGIPSGFSQRALDTDIKTKQIHQKQNGRGVVLATGTPITNTMAEAYIMLQLATPRVLEEYGIHNFDEFANTFGDTKSDVEFTWSGAFKSITRFKRFVNGQELVRLIRSGFDVKMGNKELGLKVPDIKGGTPELVIVPPTETYDQVNDMLMGAAAAFEGATGKERLELSWVPITVMQAGMAAALDPRLIDPSLPDQPGSKLNTAADRIAEIHQKWDKKRGAQLVFADRFYPMNVSKLQDLAGGVATDVDIDMSDENDTLDALRDEDANEKALAKAQQAAEAAAIKGARFNLYKDLVAKLVARGIPREQIALIHDAGSDGAREALFDKVKSGEIRVLIGSTEKLGVGVNVQDRLVAMHHLDPPRTMTPAMMEQRDGRIIRQGNLFATDSFDGEKNPEFIKGFEIEILKYGTERSMDTGVYQLLENKQRFIVQALSGRGVGREFDDPGDEVLLNMQQMKAMLTGDPRVLRMVELKQIVDTLRDEKDGHESQIMEKRSQIQRIKDDAKFHEGLAEKERRQGAFLRTLVGDDVVVRTLTGEEASGVEAAVELLKPKWEWAGKSAIEATSKKQTVLFTINGADAVLEARAWRDENGKDVAKFEVDITPRKGNAEKDGVLIRTPTPGRLFSGIRQLEQETDVRVARSLQSAENYRKEAEQLAAEKPTPFEKQKELIDAETELAALEDALTGKKDKAPTGAEGVVQRPGETSRVDRLLGALDRFATEASQRLRSRARERGTRLYSNPVPDPRDVLDASIVVAARATSAGIKGGRALTKLTNETIAAVAPHLQAASVRVRTMARALLRKAGEKGENLEAAVGEVLRVKPVRRSKVKGVVNQATGVAKDPDPAMDQLQDQYRTVRKAAGKIYQSGYRDAVAHAKARAKSLVLELRGLAAWERQNREDLAAQQGAENAAALQAATTEAREQRRRATSAEARLGRAERIQEIRSEVAQLAKALPPALRFKYLPAAVATTTARQLAKVGLRMQTDLNLWEARQSLKRIKKLSKRKYRSLFPAGAERQKFLKLIDEAEQARMWLRGVGKVGTTGLGRWSLSRRLNATLLATLQDMHAMVSDAMDERGEAITGKKNRMHYERQDMLATLKKTPVLGGVETGDKDMGLLKRAIAADLHLGRVLKALDTDWWGKGPFYRGYRKLVSSRRRWLADKHAFTDTFEAVVKKHGHKSLMHFLVENDGILGTANQAKGIGVSLGGRELTRAEAMYVYAMDPGTKESMESGQTFNFLDAPESPAFEITPALLQKITNALSAADRAIVDEAKALYQERYFDRLSDVSMQLNGTHLDRVDGYFGIKRNIRKSPTIRDPRSWRGAMQPALENAAMLQGRTGGRTPIFVGSFGREMLLRSDAASKVVNVAIPLRDAFGTMLHPQVREQVAERFGAAAVRRIEDTLVEYGVGQNEPDALLRPIQWANSNVSRVAVQLWVPTMLRNLGGVSKLTHLFSAADVAKHIGAVFDADVWRKVRQLPELRERWSHGLYMTVTPTQSSLDVGGLSRKELAGATIKQIAQVAKEARGALSPRGRRRLGEAFKGADRAWRALNQTLDWANWFDGAAARVAWAILDEKAKKDHPGWSQERREEWVGRETERAFYDTANTNDVLHSSYWAQRGRANPLIGMALTFTSDINQSRNILLEGWKRGTLARSTMAVAGSWAWAAAVTALVLAIRAAAMGGDDEYAKKLGMNSLSEAATQVPLGRLPAAGMEFFITRRVTSSFSDTPIHGVVDGLAGGIVDMGKGVARGPGKTKRQSLTGTDLMTRGAMRSFVEVNRILGNPFSPYLNELRKIASP